MAELDVYLRLCARRRGRAVPAESRRHVWLAEPPLVVAGYHLAGEPGAPVAVCYGTHPDRMRIVAVDEPRDRAARFAALTRFAADLANHLDRYTARVEQVRDGRRGRPADTERVCAAAPQLMVPNTTTAAWLCDLLGRSLRYLRTDGDHPVEQVLPAAGAHLTFLAAHRVLPGSSLVLAATDLLSAGWRTGQLPTEDADLHTLLAWIDPPDGVDGPGAAAAAERYPPAGPVPDPVADVDLAAAVGAASTGRAPTGDAGADSPVARLAADALRPAWRATWRARELIAALPEAAHVTRRADADRRAWTRHLDRVATHTAHFARRLDTLRSFTFLAELEKRTAELERTRALDDPLVMARYVAAGDALAGTVTGRDLEAFGTTARGSRVRRPVLRVRPELAFDRPAGTRLWLADRTSVQVVVDAPTDDGELTCTVVRGMGRSLAQADAALPDLGERVVLAGFGPPDTFGATLPDELPWTHRGPADDDPAGRCAGDAPPGDAGSGTPAGRAPGDDASGDRAAGDGDPGERALADGAGASGSAPAERGAAVRR